MNKHGNVRHIIYCSFDNHVPLRFIIHLNSFVRISRENTVARLKIALEIKRIFLLNSMN